MGTKNSDTNYQVRAASRALQILKIFKAEQPELGLSEISDLTGLNKSTVLRLLSVLEEEGFVEQMAGNEKYSLGIKAFEIGSIYFLSNLKVSQIARPFMEELCTKLNLSSNLAILDKNEIVYIAVEEPQKIIRTSFSIGARFGLHFTALGKVLLSNISEEKIDSIIKETGSLIKRTEKTITSPEELKKHLKSVKQQGYAIDDEEALIGLKCIAAPIYDYSRRNIAALSISGMSIEIPDSKVSELAKVLKETTNMISSKLGYQVLPEK